MNLAALPELLLSWVKNQGTALLQSDRTQPAAFQAGQQYEGKVVDQLASGRHLVKVGNQMLDMNLPARTQPGEIVRLTYLNAGPRPTFLLDQAPISPTQPVQISNTAQQVNALLRLAQPQSQPASATAAVVTTPSPSAAAANSSTAMTSPPSAAKALPESVKANMQLAAATSAVSTPPVSAAASRPIAANVLMLQSFTAGIQPMTATLTGPLTGLLGQAVDAPRATVSASTTLSANTLVELPSPSRHMLPVRLSQTVSESGLFYEAHLAKWSRGVLSLETLMREPQARLAQDSPDMARLVELDGMPEAAARMAGRQLQMLEGAPFLWQGLAWPGQTMQWLVREEGAGTGQDGAGEGAAEWVTELNLSLPRLGEVHAQLALAGDHLRLRLSAKSAATRSWLEDNLASLSKGFEANGLQALDLRVEAMMTESGHGAG